MLTSQLCVAQSKTIFCCRLARVHAEETVYFCSRLLFVMVWNCGYGVLKLHLRQCPTVVTIYHRLLWQQGLYYSVTANL